MPDTRNVGETTATYSCSTNMHNKENIWRD